jgi:hypothetical protein
VRRSIETTRRSELGGAADYGYCASHRRYFWGFRLHGLFALDGTHARSLPAPPQEPARLPAAAAEHRRALDGRNAREQVLGRLRGGGRSRLDRVRARDDGHANLPALVEQSGAPDLPGGGRGLARGLRGDGERARSARRRRPLELAGGGLRRGKLNDGNAQRRERRVMVVRGQPERARRRIT